MLPMFFSRTRFHRLVWNTPRVVLLVKLGVGDADFLKLCRDNRISTPPAHALATPTTSNQPHRARLPKRELGENPFVFLVGDFTSEEQGPYLSEMLSEPLDDLEDMIGRFRKRLAGINEHDDPFRLHEAIASLVHPMPVANDETVADARREQQRRLNLLNEIFLYAEALGGHCRFGGLDGHRHAIRIGHMNVFFTLARFDQTDRLRLEIVSQNHPTSLRTRWEDTGSVTLETILPELMVGMGLVAETMCRQERDSWNSESSVLIGDRSPLKHALHG